jgi:hypothetical protein
MAHKISKPLNLKRRFWLKHIRRWQQADITQLQYCDKHNLSLAAFRWWRSRFLNMTALDLLKHFRQVCR